MATVTEKSEPSERRPRYPQEFRRDAASLVIDQNRTIVDVARELGVVEQALGNWVRQERTDRGDREGTTTEVPRGARLSPSAYRYAMTAQRVARVLWRRRVVCAAVALIVLLVGSVWLITRPQIYQSSSSVALLPVTTNSGVLPNYPNLISSLIPTYIQLVSSPVLLDEVVKDLPFPISEGQLASDVYGQSLSNAAVISIVAQNPSATRAQIIAARTTAVFLKDLKGNRVVIPQIYSQPTVPANPSSPKVKVVLLAVFAMAIVLGLGAGLIWDRLVVDDVGQAEEPPRFYIRSALAALQGKPGPAFHDNGADERQVRPTVDPQGRRQDE